MASPLSTSSIPPPSTSLDLKPGVAFIIRGPSVYRDITPPENYPLPAPDSSQPPRPVHQALLGPQGLAQSASEWEVKVLENFRACCGCGRHSVSVEVEQEGNDRGKGKKFAVRLHLSYPSIRGSQVNPVKQLSSVGYLARYTLESDAANYHAYRRLQGREIPICYGIYSVNLGGVETTVALIEQPPNTRFYNSTQWATLGAAAGKSSNEKIVMTVDAHSGPPLEYTAKMLQVKMSSEFKCLRRFLACEPSKLPQLGVVNVAISPSSTMDSIHYIQLLHAAPFPLDEVKVRLKLDYLRYCASSENTRPPVFRERDFEDYLPSLVLLVAEGCSFETVVNDLKGVLFRKWLYSLTWNDTLPL